MLAGVAKGRRDLRPKVAQDRLGLVLMDAVNRQPSEGRTGVAAVVVDVDDRHHAFGEAPADDLLHAGEERRLDGVAGRAVVEALRPGDRDAHRVEAPGLVRANQLAGDGDVAPFGFVAQRDVERVADVDADVDFVADEVHRATRERRGGRVADENGAGQHGNRGCFSLANSHVFLLSCRVPFLPQRTQRTQRANDSLRISCIDTFPTRN